MNEFIEKLTARLEEKITENTNDDMSYRIPYFGLCDAIEIVNQLAEEYKDKYVSKTVLEQVMWERDVAIEQLKELGYELGEKVGWIPVSERLPENCDNEYYMCIIENHEEDLPMFCQYDEEYGFGFWHDIYDGYTLGFVDSEFRTNEELGYEKVIAWQPLPETYK